MEIIFLMPLFVGVVTCLCSFNFLYRMLGLKLSGDALAVFMLNFNNKSEVSDISLTSLSIISLMTTFVMLMAIVSEREFGKK
ncbi:MAG: hypothetical protein AB7F59_01005 [Bdellovibrionales bacterium]